MRCSTSSRKTSHDGIVTYRIIFHEEARLEAIEFVRYLSEESSVDTALAWRAGLMSATDSLTEFPHRCPFSRENEAFENIELRQLIYKSHRLIFTVRGNEVHVLHVRHGAQEGLEEL